MPAMPHNASPKEHATCEAPAPTAIHSTLIFNILACVNLTEHVGGCGATEHAHLQPWELVKLIEAWQAITPKGINLCSQLCELFLVLRLGQQVDGECQCICCGLIGRQHHHKGLHATTPGMHKDLARVCNPKMCLK
jgi:hypothetical protein